MATGMDYSLVQRIIDGLGKILDTKPGSPDEGTYVTEQQLADWIKGQTVVSAYYYNGVMYSDALHTTPITGQAGALYIDQDNNVLYRWDGAAWDAMSDNQLRQDILDGTVVAKKAECDEDGNNIKATYATKAEMQAADATLQSQVDNLDHRLENLEQSKGDYSVSAYKDGSITPSGKGKWCVVEGVEGVSRVANQLVQDYDFSVASGWSVFQCSVASGGVITTTGTSVNKSIYRNIASTSGHVMLAICSVTVSRASTCRLNICGSYSESVSVPANKKTLLIYLGTPNYNNSNVTLYFDIGGDMQVGDTCTVDFFCASGLSVYFAGDPSVNVSSLTIADIQRDYPHLLLPTDYGTRIVDWTGNGVRAWSANLLNFNRTAGTLSGAGTGTVRSFEEGKYYAGLYMSNYYDTSPISNVVVNGTTLTATISSGGCGVAFPIKCRPSSAYWAKITTATSCGLGVSFYDKDGNFISYTGSGTSSSITVTTPANASWLVLIITYNSAVSFSAKDVVIGEGSTVGTFTPYFVNTLSFPSTSLKSAGSVREKKLLNVEVEIDGQKVQKSVKTNPIGSYTFTADDAWEVYYAPNGLYSIPFPLMKVGSANAILLGYTFYDSYSAWGDASDKALYKSSDGRLYVKNVACTSLALIKAEMAGRTLTYELDTPDPDTYSDPILDNTLLTEAYGRMSTVQTGTVVDGIADLGFITL